MKRKFKFFYLVGILKRGIHKVRDYSKFDDSFAENKNEIKSNKAVNQVKLCFNKL